MPISCDSYVKVWLLMSGAVLLAVAPFNLIVDPDNCFRWVSLRKLDDVRGTDEEAAMLATLNHGDWDVALFGSSRARRGLDPGHPSWGSPRVCTVGIDNATTEELAQIICNALRAGRCKKVVLCLDFFMFSRTRTAGPNFEFSARNPAQSKIDRHVGSLFGARTTERSVRLVRDYIRGDRRPKLQFGELWRLSEEHANLTAHEKFQKILEGFRARGKYTAYPWGPGPIRQVQRVVEMCHTSGTQLILIILPVHAVQLEAIRAAGVWSGFEQWKRDLVHVATLEEKHAPDAQRVSLWDFTGYVGYTAEPVPATDEKGVHMRWYWESSHFKKPLGDLVIQRICGKEVSTEQGTPFGIKLSRDNIEDHLARIRADRAAYARTHPAECLIAQRIWPATTLVTRHAGTTLK